MLYVTCPTCGYFISQKVIKYEEEKEKICNNQEFTIKERESELSKLVLSLNLRRYCCKMRIMTYKDVVKDILPVPAQK